MAQPFSSKFHSIPDGSNRYCCVQIHCCGMIFLLQFFFFFPLHVHDPLLSTFFMVVLNFCFSFLFSLSLSPLPPSFFSLCFSYFYICCIYSYIVFHTNIIFSELQFQFLVFLRIACISTQKYERRSQAGGVYTAGDILLPRTPS